MKFLILLALLGQALAFQAPVEYEYRYSARVGTGMQTSRPQYAGTGIKAKVLLTMQRQGEGLIEVKDVQVGDGNHVLDNNGRDELPISYQRIRDRALELPFKAYFNKHDGERVMDVPSSDLQWVTNVRRGIANMFRIAPLMRPSIVHSSSGDRVEPQAFSMREDTHAGRCRVGYSMTPAAIYDIISTPSEDIQSQEARKGPGGDAIRLSEQRYRLQSAIEYSTCSDRVFVSQTGAGNLTNFTDSTFRDLSSRSHVSQYIIKGSPGKFRIESALVENQLVFNPFGFDTEKMVVVSNQTLFLQAARPVPSGVERATPSMRQIQTWRHQMVSPNRRPQGYAPRYVVYKGERQQQSYNPVFFERIATGFGYPDASKNQVKNRIIEVIHNAAHRLDRQNRDSDQQQPTGYGGSEDGRAAQDLHDAHKLIRALPIRQLRELYNIFKSETPRGSVTKDLFVETLAVAGSGPSLDLVMEIIEHNQISENRTASIFFNMANNVQSPEVLERMIRFVMRQQEDQHVMMSLMAKINLAQMIQRLCVHRQERTYSHMQYLFGDKMCDKTKLVRQYLPHLEQKIKQSNLMWVKILNVLAASDLGARESLPILEKVARGQISNDKYLRFAAIHGMRKENFDNSTRDQIFNILQPIAESQVEDYRIRQVAYNTLLMWKPNVTFLHRMVSRAPTESSKQMQTFIYWVVDSLSRVEDISFRPLSTAAKNLIPITQYMDPSLQRPMNYIASQYLVDDLIGATGHVIWVSGIRQTLPREVYVALQAKFGRFFIPLFETVTFKNQHTMSAHQSHYEPELSAEAVRQPDLYHFSKFFKSSGLFLPLTNDLYQTAMEHGHSMMSGQHHRVVAHKYMNPVEVNVILPTPTGLFMNIEMSTPTVMYANMTVNGTAPKDTPELRRRLPSLHSVNVQAEGIVKLVSKVNTYSYVIAPWTNKTVVAAVDNEKSISLPMKIHAVSEHKSPSQICWAKITPQFRQLSSKVPVMKIRNVPFTAVGGFFPSTQHPQSIQSFRTIRSLYSDQEERTVVVPISKQVTGLNAEVYYRGEPQPPMVQPNIWNYISEPSRLMMLLASPSVKHYDLTVYQRPERNPTESIGIFFRHLDRPGQSSESGIRAPESSQQPIDISADDSQQQREQKLSHFSRAHNHDYSIRVNFTGQQQTKVYEASIIMAKEFNRTQSNHRQSILRKIQVSLLQKNQESSRRPKTCLVLSWQKPELQSIGSVNPSLIQQHFMHSVVGLNVYEGSSCKQGDTPVARSRTDLSLSNERMNAILNVTDSGDYYYNQTSEFYRLAVYDQLRVDAHYGNQSPQLQNITLRARDLVEGYLFPKIVKNRMVTNEDGRMTIYGNRSVADNRMNARITTPRENIDAQRVHVQTWFDMLIGFTGESSSSDHPMTASFENQRQCKVYPSRVVMYNEQSYEKKQSTCDAIVARVVTPESEIKVYSRHVTLNSPEQEIKVLSQTGDLKVVFRKETVKVNDVVMTEQRKEIKDASGRLIAVVRKTSETVRVSVSDKLDVELKNGRELTIRISEQYKQETQGLCGSFDEQQQMKMVDIEKCVYFPSNGRLFTASWMPRINQCMSEDRELTQLKQELDTYRQSCQKLRSSILSRPVSRHECELEAYPITEVQDSVCVTEQAQMLCGTGCVANAVRRIRVPSKCWTKSRAPESVRSQIPVGYMTEPVRSTPESENEMMFTLPASCSPRRALSSASCAIQAYPVVKHGSELCVSKVKVNTCRDPRYCEIIDAQTRKVDCKCWPENSAPHEVKKSYPIGYTKIYIEDREQVIRPIDLREVKRCSRHH